MQKYYFQCLSESRTYMETCHPCILHSRIVKLNKYSLKLIYFFPWKMRYIPLVHSNILSIISRKPNIYEKMEVAHCKILSIISRKSIHIWIFQAWCANGFGQLFSENTFKNVITSTLRTFHFLKHITPAHFAQVLCQEPVPKARAKAHVPRQRYT